MGLVVTTLNLGVIDQPYVTPPAPGAAPKKGKRVGPHAAHAAKYATTTTGDVANILEHHYSVMGVFWDDVGAALFFTFVYDDIDKMIRAMIMGAPAKTGPQLYAPTTQRLVTRFKQYLSNSEIESSPALLGGVPTRAALRGVSHRFKSGFNWIMVIDPVTGKKTKITGVRRPSFIDTGLYQASFATWVDS